MLAEKKLDLWNTCQSARADMAAEEPHGLLAKSVTRDCVYSGPSYEGVDALIARIEGSQAKVPSRSRSASSSTTATTTMVCRTGPCSPASAP